MMLLGVPYLGWLGSVTLGGLILWKSLLKISVKYLPWLPHVMPSVLLSKRGQGPLLETDTQTYLHRQYSQPKADTRTGKDLQDHLWAGTESDSYNRQTRGQKTQGEQSKEFKPGQTVG